MKKIIVVCLISLFALVNTCFAQDNQEKKFIKDFNLVTKYSYSLCNSSQINSFILNYSDKNPNQPTQSTKKKSDWIFIGEAGTYFILSMLDLHSTYRALANGHKEVNPFMAAMINNKPLAITIKMGTTLLTIYAFHQWKKRNKLAACVAFGLVIVVHAYIVYHNYKVGGPIN